MSDPLMTANRLAARAVAAARDVTTLRTEDPYAAMVLARVHADELAQEPMPATMSDEARDALQKARVRFEQIAQPGPGLDPGDLAKFAAVVNATKAWRTLKVRLESQHAADGKAAARKRASLSKTNKRMAVALLVVGTAAIVGVYMLSTTVVVPPKTIAPMVGLFLAVVAILRGVLRASPQDLHDLTRGTAQTEEDARAIERLQRDLFADSPEGSLLREVSARHPRLAMK